MHTSEGVVPPVGQIAGMVPGGERRLVVEVRARVRAVGHAVILLRVDHSWAVFLALCSTHLQQNWAW